ncbi:alpha/beta hydrolase [Spirulina sp. CS-785/01]|uniref:alpha/beta fold hydrolase n=1 Tax=Spirulina sp. CS-785/01 TaxID=3021716 RepID=UPI00232D87F4|nr:alpha/beta hydrolase [Spirulina sp. CS-785/01]MDB9314032.1 alpha/beta hydrolase [Spirulina sp. CS-785/01]
MSFKRRNLTLSSGLNLSYLETERGQHPLMLLHGLADHGLVWSSLAQTLGSDYHIVAPDLRGHGESSKPPQGYSFAAMIADIQELMAHLGWSSAHILGHSWGAKLAAIWATRFPEQGRSLILVDPFFIGKLPMAFKVTFPLLYRVLPFLKLMRSFPTYEEAETLAKGLKQYRGWSPLQQQVFQNAIKQQPDGTWTSKFTVAARQEIFEDVMRVDGLTEELSLPALLVLPEKGLNRTNWQINPFRHYLANLQIISVPGNHWAFLVEPETFNSVIQEFLDQQKKSCQNPE